MRAVPEITRAGLRLRPWRDDDAQDVLELARDPACRAWMPTLRRVEDLGGALRWIEQRREPDRVDWLVCDAATGTPAARVGLHHLDDRSRAAEIGYAVWPAMRGRGVAARAVDTATRYGFDRLGLARVTLLHALGNRPSCAVATRSGFAFEGVERSAMDHGDGVLHDLHRHARLATDPPGPCPPPPPPLEPVELRAGPLLLRPWREDDVEDVLAGLSDPLTARWTARPVPDLCAARSWLAGRAERWATGAAATWAVVEAGRVVGSMGLRELNRVDAFAVASYWTMPQARGRGVAGRALARAATYAFDVLGLHRVELAHAVANTGSCRVAEKTGFRLEGTLRGSNRLAEGFVDEHLHARLATDGGDR